MLQEINGIQNTCLMKLNVLYSLAFIHSRNTINNILEGKRLISLTEPIPKGHIAEEFDQYFK
jgi:hypothetical protein